MFKLRMSGMVCLLSLLLIGGVQGQGCVIGDDGFNIGCCVPVQQANLPNFPALTLGGRYGCLRNCTLEAEFTPTVVLGAPTMVTCDYYVIPLTVGPAAGPVSFSGSLLAKYARTWTQPNAAGQQRQIWRFLVNTDATFNITAVSGIPCPVPPSAIGPAGNPTPVHFVGHIDYACQFDPTVPTGQSWRVAMSLTHFKGCLSHAPFSQRPLVGPAAHNDRTYVLVAPSAFSFMPVPEPMGPVIAESTRSSFLSLLPAFSYQCFGEARMGQGNLQTISQNCLSCGPIPIGVPNIWKHQMLNATAFCNGVAVPVNSIPVPGLFPGGLAGLTVGRWAATSGFPGAEDLTVYVGAISQPPLCSAIPSTGFHVVTGVGTRNTQPGVLWGPPGGPPITSRQFVDLQNMRILPLLQPGIGSLFASDQIWNLNLP